MEVTSFNITHNIKGNMHDNTSTFIVGILVLIIFIILGIVASIFLCMTVKKDMYLWEVDRLRQLEEKENEGNNEDEEGWKSEDQNNPPKEEIINV